VRCYLVITHVSDYRNSARSENSACGLRDCVRTNNLWVFFLISRPEPFCRFLFHFDLNVVLLDMIFPQDELTWVFDEHTGIGFFNVISDHTGYRSSRG